MREKLGMDAKVVDQLFPKLDILLEINGKSRRSCEVGDANRVGPVWFSWENCSFWQQRRTILDSDRLPDAINESTDRQMTQLTITQC